MASDDNKVGGLFAAKAKGSSPAVKKGGPSEDEVAERKARLQKQWDAFLKRKHEALNNALDKERKGATDNLF